MRKVRVLLLGTATILGRLKRRLEVHIYLHFSWHFTADFSTKRKCGRCPVVLAPSSLLCVVNAKQNNRSSCFYVLSVCDVLWDVSCLSNYNTANETFALNLFVFIWQHIGRY